LVLLLLDFWPLRRLKVESGKQKAETGEDSRGKPKPESSTFSFQFSDFRFCLLEKLPFFFAALVFTVTTVFAQKGAGAVQSAGDLPLMARFDNALLSYVRYLGQTVWPSGLAAYYPYPHSFATGAIAAVSILLLGVSVL